MTKVNSSPDRYTFQNSSDDLAEVLADIRNRDRENLVNPEWQKHNLEWDLRSTQWICRSAKSTKTYAQNLYAALCNNQFQKQEVWPLLQGKQWSCSWRYAGGIVSDMLERGDYLDWYCSGIRDPDTVAAQGYVGEGAVTEQIREDLKRLGWHVATE